MNSFLETLKQLGPPRLAIMGAVLLGLMLFFVFVSVRVSSTDMNLLYSDLSTMDSSAMAAKLEEVKIPYQVSQDGARIMVPDTEVGRARMLLAQAGLPNGGSLGYEIFDKQSGFGTTNAVQNINAVRALEGELARTISSLEPVRSARVHLVLPQRELFARETRPASASVAIGLRPGKRLESEQIASIQSLVASAVPELKMESVSIIDQNGTLLARGGDSAETRATLKAEEMRLKHEQRLIQTIEDLVGRTVGYGKVRASVTAELNFDRISTAEELYNPEQQVARSTQTTEENSMEREASEDNVSVETNLPSIGGDLLGGNAPTATANRIEEVTNYEISRTVRNTVREGGDVRRLSVAVLIDGTYTANEAGERVYEPRSEAEVDKIAALVRSAVGLDAARGDTLEVINMQFAQIDTSEDMPDNTLFGFDKNKLLDVAEVVTVAIMIILVILLVLQPMVGRLLAAERDLNLDEDEEADLLTSGPRPPALEGPAHEFESSGLEDEDGTMIDVQKVEGKVKASAVKKVEDIVDAYPSETVSVIRSWMTQD
ncbi:MAG: flagellar basal-body MS-ring/collar protein FliF [Micavibrio sp.]